MDLFELQKNIKNKTLPKLLIFTGPEYEIMNVYINQILKIYNLNKMIVDTINTAFEKSKGISIIKTNCLYISKYEKQFLTTETNWSKLDRLNSNYAIIIQSNIDERTKFFKQFEDNIVKFDVQNDATIKIMLNKKHNLSEKNLDRLLQNCSYNYSRIVKELNKIRLLADYNNITEDESYSILLKDKSIQEDCSVEIPQFIDAVMKKDRSCLPLYYILRNMNTSNIVLISWLYNAVKNQLLVQGTSKPTTESTGLNYYFLKECFGRTNYYSNHELINFMKLLKDCEQGIKNGKYDESNIIEYILVNCIGGVKCMPNA